MAESSACLVRSFSTPAETSYEGNPIHALGESISFGKFMTESLNWEKWSAFSHNRYVEEAEKYSKPGSVAAKKAYFEAHYKKKAAERAAVLMQEANAQANGSLESEVLEGNCADSSFEMSSEVDRDQHKCDAGQIDLEISNVEGAEDVAHPPIDTNFNVGSCSLVHNSNSNQFHHVEDSKNVAVPVEESALDNVNGTADREVSASPVKGREVNSSPKLSTRAVAAKHSRSLDERKAAASLPPRSGINNGPKGKKTVGDFVEKKRLTAKSPRMSINVPPGTGETRERTAAASQLRNGLNNFSISKKSVGGLNEKKRMTMSSLYMSINLPSGAGIISKPGTADTKPRSRINLGAKIMKSVGDSAEKRSTTRSLHMSISLPSGAGETSKTASVLEQNRIKKIHSNLPKNNPVALLNQALANPLSQGRRTERLPNKSVSGRVTANAKPSSSISSDCLKSSSTTKSNPQSATISLPFRFRSEERAVKRKEFLQRIDETKSKEEEKDKLQRTLKGKTEHDHKKLRQSSGSLSKLNVDKHGGSQSPSNQTRKISPTLPRSPKVGWRANSSTVQDKSLRNSWKPSISTNNSKRTTEKIKITRTTRQSVTSLSNATRENASPNIQLREKRSTLSL